MKKTSYQLNISNPCQESWEGMDKHPDGQFCKSCLKTVIDFTVMSDNEIRTYFEKNEGKVCGRLHHSQIHRFLEYQEPQKRSSLHHLLSGLLFILSGNTFAANAVEKQKTIKVVATQNITARNKEQKDQLFLDQSNDTIKGRITDEKLIPLPGAIIFLRGSNIQTATNRDGRFSLTIPSTHLSEQKVLEITYISFEKQQLILKKKDYLKEVNVKMVESCDILLGEVVIVKPQQKLKKKKGLNL